MNILTRISDWQKVRKEIAVHKSVGFVPTMGHLHEGHRSLCERAKKENHLSIVSIFVNPTQFNEQKDFVLYPRTLDRDIGLLETIGIDYLFIPQESDMYADDYHIQVSESQLSQELEGEFRPGHFNGMLTVVLKLLNLIQPTRAYFGEKDYQQLLLVKKMVLALFLPVEIVACPTIRAQDGLALSSRNSRLNLNQRQQAAQFAQLLASTLSIKEIEEMLKKINIKVDYVAEKWGRRLAAVWVDDVRLIDNVSIEG